MESSQPRNHELHIAGKGFTSTTHFNLEHKFVPMLQAIKILDAKGAVDKQCENHVTITTWQLEKVEGKEVILETQRDKAKLHFSTVMDTCHVKCEELEPTLQKCKGRVRGDIVEDDSGAHAVFN